MTDRTITRAQQSPAERENAISMDPYRLAHALAQSGYFADVRDASQALVKILYGQELGISPISAMMGIYIIAGKLVLSAPLIATAIKRSGLYDYHVLELTPEVCTLHALKRGECIGTSTFTIEDAQRAGLMSEKNAGMWKKYPRNMLFARALTNLARWHLADLYGGAPVYTAEELDIPVDEQGDMLGVNPAAAAEPPAVEAPTTAEEAPGLALVPPDPGAAEPDREHSRATTPPFCVWPECGVVLTLNQLVISMRHFGRPLCVKHQKEQRQEQRQEQRAGAVSSE